MQCLVYYAQYTSTFQSLILYIVWLTLVNSSFLDNLCPIIIGVLTSFEPSNPNVLSISLIYFYLVTNMTRFRWCTYNPKKNLIFQNIVISNSCFIWSAKSFHSASFPLKIISSTKFSDIRIFVPFYDLMYKFLLSSLLSNPIFTKYLWSLSYQALGACFKT